jgi:hypothetical protein
MDRYKIAELSPTAILWDGYDEAIIGLADRENFQDPIFYSYDNPITIELDGEAYNEFEEEDIDKFDRWGRENFVGVAVYDIEKTIEICANGMEVNDFDIQEYGSKRDAQYMLAIEYLDYNLFGAYLGEMTPIHINIKEKQ